MVNKETGLRSETFEGFGILGIGITVAFFQALGILPVGQYLLLWQRIKDGCLNHWVADYYCDLLSSIQNFLELLPYTFSSFLMNSARTLRSAILVYVRKALADCINSGKCWV